MSTEEMRDFCQSVSSYQLRIQVRLKNASEILVGKVVGVEAERFRLVMDDDGEQLLRYAWIARISNV